MNRSFFFAAFLLLLKIISRVLLVLGEPHWDSGMILDRIFLVTERGAMPWLLPLMDLCPLFCMR